MFIPVPAVAFFVIGAAIWALTFWCGPSFAYGDVQTRHRRRIVVGAMCFALATLIMLREAIPT